MHGKIVLSIITLGISLGVTLMSIGMPVGRNTSSTLTWPPNAWPLLTAGGLAVLAVILLLGSLKEAKSIASNENESASNTDNLSDAEGLRGLQPKRWIMVVVIFLYLFLMNFFGFIISTLLFIVIATRLMGMKKWLTINSISVSLTVVLTLIFPIYLNIFVPRGAGIFRSFSLLFY